jgi:glycosyltransferase involved in cell wall biosynthesis
MLEAFSFGKPIIASQIGEFSRIVPQIGLGLLFNFRDHLDLAEKIALLWNTEGLALQLGQNARQYVERYLTADYHYQRLAEIISRIRTLA